MNRAMRFTLAVTALAAMTLAAAAQSLPPRRSFDIATGSAAGSYFSVGEVIARVVSHPPGLALCEKSPLCGPPGMIVSARSSDGVAANVLAVNSGSAASGLAQANVVADALAGRGAFAHAGRQTHIRVIADLFAEQVQLVVSRGSKIRSVADLKGRRVSLGVAGSGTDIAAAEILAAFGVQRLKRIYDSAETSGGLLREGKLDAFFVLDPAPTPLVADMVDRGQARVVAIEGMGRKRLLAAAPGLSADTIAPGTYRGAVRLETVATHAYWIVRDSASAETVYGLVRALYHPDNQARLAQEAMPSKAIRLPDGAGLAGVTLHPGAARYYREIGVLK